MRTEKDEEGLAALLAASITPREHLDEVTSALVPYRAARVKQPLFTIEVIPDDYDGLVVSFDGSANLKTNAGSASFVVWQLPSWTPVYPAGLALTDVTVNKAEYCGLLSGLRHVLALGVTSVVVIGDSRLVIEQCQGTMWANKKNLEDLLGQYTALREKFQSTTLIYVRRDFNAAAYYLASKALRLSESFVVSEDAERTHLAAINKLPERVTSSNGDDRSRPDEDSAAEPSATIFAVSTRRTRSTNHADPHPQSAGVSSTHNATVGTRLERVKAYQLADSDMKSLVRFLSGDIESAATVADLYVLDSTGVLRNAGTKRRDQARRVPPRLVVPIGLRQDVLHMCHDDYQGGTKGSP